MAKNIISSLPGKGRKKVRKVILMHWVRVTLLLHIACKPQWRAAAWGQFCMRRGCAQGTQVSTLLEWWPMTSLPKGCSVFPSIVGLLTVTCSGTIANTRQSIEQAGWEPCKKGRSSWTVPSGHPRDYSLFGTWEFYHKPFISKQWKALKEGLSGNGGGTVWKWLDLFSKYWRQNDPS